MDYIYIDTALLAVPNYAIDGQTAEEIISRVNYFSQVAVSDLPVALVISAEAEAVLWDAHCGPDYGQIEEFIQLMQLTNIFSARDLVTQYQTILDRAIRANSIGPAEVTAVSDFQSLPSLPAMLNPQFLRAETERIFSSVALRHSLEPPWSVGCAIHGAGGQAYSVDANIDGLTGDCAGECGPVPISLHGTAYLISHLSQLVSEYSSTLAWNLATDANELHFSIMLKALWLLDQAGQPTLLSNLREFVIGPNFIASLRSNQCFRKDRYGASVHTLCAQIVADLCSKRIGVFGKPKQLVRKFDSALAWRVHLTKGSEGLRLMFWDNGAEIEFANVGPKHELRIENGCQSAGVGAKDKFLLSH